MECPSKSPGGGGQQMKYTWNENDRKFITAKAG